MQENAINDIIKNDYNEDKTNVFEEIDYEDDENIECFEKEENDLI